MNNPLVTVFIPIYNSERHIKETLKSVINQTYKNLEILIIDDGSTDRSVEIVKSFEDKRIRLLRNNENKGIPYTRNRALLEAKGKYLALLDSDDIAYENRIEIQVEFMENNPDIDVVASNYEIINGKKSKLFKSRYKNNDEIRARLIFSNCICNSSTLMLLSTIRKHGIKYNEAYFVAQDYDFFVQVSKIGKICILPEILVKYRTGHLNITKKSNQEKLFERKMIIDSIHEDILSHYQFNLTYEQLNTFNEFFSHESHKINKVVSFDMLSDVLMCILEQNRKETQFNNELFSKIIVEATNDFIVGHKMPLSKKVNLFRKINRNLGLKRDNRKEILIILKHIYRKLLSK